MNDTERVQKLYSNCELASNFLGSLLSQPKLSQFEIIKQVTTTHQFENQIETISIFEEVHESHNIRVLRHLHDLYFPFSLLGFN